MTLRFALDLEHGRAVAVAVEDRADDHPADRAAAAQRSPHRAREYLAGRRALRAAIAAVGGIADDAGLEADDRGAPVLPPGLVGSISHKRDLAVGLAAPALGWRVGVDLEVMEPRPTDITARVLTDAEQAAIAGEPEARRRVLVVRAFSIKEAVYKAIDPYLRRYVGFLEVALDHPAADAPRLIVPDAWGLEVEVACAAHGSHWLATARARPR